MLFPQVTYPIVIWGLYSGVVAGAVGTVVARFTTGSAVRALIAEGATDPENAKTARELGLSGLSRRALHGSLYGKLFLCANADEAKKPSRRKKPREYEKPRLDMPSARFYLPKDKEDEALARFPRPSVPGLVVGIILLTALFTALHLFLPSLVDVFISSFTG